MAVREGDWPSGLRWSAPVTVRGLRLSTGLIIFTFLTTHLLNHALGIVSLEAMAEAQDWFVAVWRSVPGTVLLYGSFLVHAGLALLALYRRRTLRMPAADLWQLVLGLSIPFLLIPHVLGTRVRSAMSSFEDTYEVILQLMWVEVPTNGLRQAFILVVAWVHGCIGLHFWLRHRRWYPRAFPVLFALALMVPVLALIGFAQAGRDVALLVEANGLKPMVPPPPVMGTMWWAAYGVAWGSLLGVLGARALRFLRQRRTLVRIRYPDRQTVAVPRGFTVLEASRLAGIPHLSVCGGRGRCSTCRVRLLGSLSDQPEPAPEERATLARVGAPPGVRLACQLRPVSDVAVIPLLRANVLDQQPTEQRWSGEERFIAVLFCDLRGFTALSEQKLPFDVVYLLNQYFAMVGNAVEREGGRVDKFIGDGAMALFGVESEPTQACRQALSAAAAIARGVEDLNGNLQRELGHPLRLAMGLHAGVAIVGEMGYGPATSLTAVGDVVNVASRLEGLAKELDAELVVSDGTVRRAGVVLGSGEARDLPVRGRTAAVRAVVLPRAGAAVVA